ncbi:MAG: hypothetical protein ABSH20_14960, partial [Tepidisphaeraceae bacterium]
VADGQHECRGCAAGHVHGIGNPAGLFETLDDSYGLGRDRLLCLRGAGTDMVRTIDAGLACDRIGELSDKPRDQHALRKDLIL